MFCAEITNKEFSKSVFPRLEIRKYKPDNQEIIALHYGLFLIESDNIAYVVFRGIEDNDEYQFYYNNFFSSALEYAKKQDLFITDARRDELIELTW